MNEYELIIEDVNPCGGEEHARKSIQEIETESPDVWMQTNARYPIMDRIDLDNGDVLFVTGNGKGNIVRYTFSC